MGFGVLGLALWALGAQAPAATKPRYSADQVFEKVLAAQEGRDWTRAHIKKKESPVRGKGPSQVSEGKLWTRPGSLARLEISKPSPSLIVGDGKYLWMELPEVQQVMRYNAEKLKASGNFFLDLASSIRHYSKASLRRLILPGRGFDPAKVSALELLPLEPDQAGFESLKVWIEERRWVVLRVQLEYGGTRSDVVFSKIETGEKGSKKAKPLPETLFQYKAPKGYEVFDLDL